ncbi:hypothetical protein PVAND_015023 [Polypedilum vanderplanki]|uniref:BTB domain-containing protein n=1 Tax=Polypedilum vanderplanki TaxID=319348 RepID=A0A9J6BBE3_POLVA|nr:hypothetical protein PVAND_015023 [Polypedilum vanderplanki]
MSFVINTTIDKNKEFIEALRNSLHNDLEKDVNFICKNNVKVTMNSYVLALASDFFSELLKDIVDKREVINIMVPDIHPDVLKKVFEYIYIGYVALETRAMGEFIEACNLLHLKATISCEKKLVFDSPQTTSAPSITSNITTMITEFDPTIKFETPATTSVADEPTEHVIQQADHTTSGQILEVYEISNIEDTDITYDDTMEEDDDGVEEHYELLNVIPESEVSSPTVAASTSGGEKKKEKKKRTLTEITDVSPKTSTPKMTSKTIDESVMEQAIKEIISNNTSFRVVSEKYSIPKTLLWRRAKKFGYVKTEKQKDDIRLLAIEAIKQGESLISLSKRYNIPISTLHREKLKLYEKGQLPENVNLKNRSRGEDYDDRLRNAISEILNGKSQNEIAKKYNIPKTTIWRIIKKMGGKIDTSDNPVTPKSEIVEQLLEMSKKRTVKDSHSYDDEKM